MGAKQLRKRVLRQPDVKIPFPRVRGADVSVKPGAQAPGSREEKRASPRSGRQPLRRMVERTWGFRPLRGLGNSFIDSPGAYAPGFMLSCAPRTKAPDPTVTLTISHLLRARSKYRLANSMNVGQFGPVV